MKRNKTFPAILLSVGLILFVVVYGYSQFLEKKYISAALQYQINLDAPPETVFAILTNNQSISKNETLPKGTRLFGKVKVHDENVEIYFDAFQKPGKGKEQFSGKVIFEAEDSNAAQGISSKLGKTFHQKTKSSVLGAIFTTSKGASSDSITSILPRGTSLKIAID